MRKLTAMLAGTGLGCLAMYAFDPEAGRRRRSEARDRINRMQRRAGAAAATAGEIKDRTLGALAGARDIFSGAGAADALTERVRAEMEHLVRYPRCIHVYVDEGRVIFSGDVLADECDQLVEGVGALRGVRAVENRLQVRQGAEDFPGLEGALKPRPEGRPIDLIRRQWSPSARLLVGVASTAALVGLGVLARSRTEANGGAEERRSH